MIEILSSGLPNLVQDLGRPQHLALGVSRSGALDTYALALANVVLGNDENAAGIEISLFPFKVRFLVDTSFCCTGADCPILLDGQVLPPWWARSARAGQVLAIGLPRRGARAYLALNGGLDVPLVMGSRATDFKTGFGGLEGRGLRRGDVLSLLPSNTTMTLDHGIVPPILQEHWAQPEDASIVVRTLPGAEHDAFTDEARAAFTSTPYRITPDANRMGYRLQGDVLRRSKPVELLSHGIVPGTVQVPPAGHPIIQMAEANTCGGYPKIATVVQADLWKLAQAQIGKTIRFSLVTHDEARAALQAIVSERDDISQRFASLRNAAPVAAHPISRPNGDTHERIDAAAID